MRWLAAALVIVAVGGLNGCGGSTSGPPPGQPTQLPAEEQKKIEEAYKQSQQTAPNH